MSGIVIASACCRVSSCRLAFHLDSCLLGPMDNCECFSVHHFLLSRSTPKTATRQPELLGLTREGARADPELREAFEILLVSACDGVFLSTVDSKTVFSRRQRSDFFYKRGVYEHRSVDADESMGFELFCHIRDRLTQQIEACLPLEINTLTLSLNRDHVAQIHKENP